MCAHLCVCVCVCVCVNPRKGCIPGIANETAQCPITLLVLSLLPLQGSRTEEAFHLLVFSPM